MFTIDLRELFVGLSPIDFVFDPAIAHISGDLYLVGVTVFRRFGDDRFDLPAPPNMLPEEAILYNPYHPYSGGKCGGNGCITNQVAQDVGGFVKNLVICARLTDHTLRSIGTSILEIEQGDNLRIIRFTPNNLSILFDKWNKDPDGEWRQSLWSRDVEFRDNNITLVGATRQLATQQTHAAIWVRGNRVWFFSIQGSTAEFGVRDLTDDAPEIQISRSVFALADYMPAGSRLSIFAPPVEFGASLMIGVGQIIINLALAAADTQLAQFAAQHLNSRRLEQTISLGFVYTIDKTSGHLVNWSKFWTFDGFASLVPCAITQVAEMTWAVAISNLKEVAQIYILDLVPLLIEMDPRQIGYVSVLP